MVRKGELLIILLLFQSSCIVTTGKLHESEAFILEKISQLEDRISQIEENINMLKENLSAVEKEKMFEIKANMVEVEAQISDLERTVRELEGEIEKKEFLVGDEISELRAELENLKNFLGENIFLYFAEKSYENEDCENIKRTKENYTAQFPAGSNLYAISYLLAKCYEKSGNIKDALKEYGFIISRGEGKYLCDSLESAIRIMENAGKNREAEVLKRKKKETCEK